MTGRLDLRERLRDPRPLMVGVVHLRALPGAPGARAGAALDEVLEAAAVDAEALATGGADAVIVENFGDAPFFPRRVPPETVAAMTRALDAVAAAAPGLALGVNVLRNDARSALGLCAATAASFLRVNVHVGAMVTDQGLLEGEAAETLRTRAALCPDALLLADVHVKHAAPLAPRPISEAAVETLGRGGADLVVVSGAHTGGRPEAGELAEVAAAVGRDAVLVGSGLDAGNAGELLAHARGAIVGTSIKQEGRLERPVDAGRVRALRETLRGD